MDDEAFMKEALKNAKFAFELGEVPVGSVMVFQENIIATGFNQVEKKQDATAHAEMICLRESQNFFNNWRLNDCVLYTTLEPCLMCFGALTLSRIKKVVYGAPDLRHGACGGCYHLQEKKHPIHNIELKAGVLEEESKALLRNFFKKVREEKL